jgi:hypothetical protein
MPEVAQEFAPLSDHGHKKSLLRRRPNRKRDGASRLPPTLPPNYLVRGGKPSDGAGQPSEKSQIDQGHRARTGMAWDQGN